MIRLRPSLAIAPIVAIVAASSPGLAEGGARPAPGAEEAPGVSATQDGPGASQGPEDEADRLDILPRDELFAPLVADPTWPRFSIQHEWRFGSDAFDRAAQVSFGESVAVVRGELAAGSAWELGLQAQVDALFDVTTRSLDLANEDYFVAIGGSYRAQRVTTQLRVAHVSAHVGDEYLLAVGGGRESVSYETIDVLVSYAATDAFRVYGGGGVFVNPSPSYDPVSFQLGAEWRSARGLSKDRLRPIAGLDLKIQQESDWKPDVAALLGLRFSRRRDDEARHVDLFVRAYHGRSPEGQFFRQDVGLVGLGLRLGL